MRYTLADHDSQCTLDALRKRCCSRSTVLLGFDVEGQEGKGREGVHSVGLASFLWPTNGFLKPTVAGPSVNLAKLVDHYQIDGQVLNFSAAPALRRYEDFPFGTCRSIDKADVESELVNTLAAIKEAHGDAQLIMVVYNSKAEFKAMRRLFPAAAQYITGWIDLYGRHGGKAKVRRVGCTGTLGHSMSLLNFEKQHLPSLSSSTHSPGMDAVRTLGVLIELLSRPDTGPNAAPCMRPPPQNPGKIKPAKVLITRYSGKMPPKSTFPHMATITMQDKNDNLASFPEHMNHPDKFWDYWQRLYAEPSAVGIKKICAVKEGSVLKTAQIGYVAFHDEDTLNLFEQLWDGRQVGDDLRILIHQGKHSMNGSRRLLFTTIQQFRNSARGETQQEDAAGAMPAEEGGLSDDEFLMPGWLD